MCANYSADAALAELRRHKQDTLAAVEDDQRKYSAYCVARIVLKFLVILIITVGCVFYFSAQQYRYVKARKFKSAAGMLHTIMVLQLLISACIFLSSVPSVAYAIALMGKKGLFSHRAVLHMQ